MKADLMVHNANQIALYFQSFPHEEAIEGVLDHILKFWERRMKDQLLNYVAKGGTGLHELVLEAVKRMPVNA
jgi:formate dehydrogenase subunit delta